MIVRLSIRSLPVPAGWLTYRALALSLVTSVSGCGAVCSGPQCASSYPASRLVVFDGGAAMSGERAVWDDADATFQSGADDGAAWIVADAGGGGMMVGQPDSGRVIRLARNGDALERVGVWDDGEDKFGAAVAVVDMVGESAFDLWVGAPATNFSRGEALLFVDAGSQGSRTSSEADLRIAGVSDGDLLGSRLVPCGDLTGDGRGDVVVTSPWFAGGTGTDIEGLDAVPGLAGAVFVVDSALVAADLALANPPERKPWEYGRVYWGGERGEGAGHAVRCGADHDGDGVVDLVIGAPWHLRGRGRVYVVSGAALPPSGSLVDVATAELVGRTEGEWFGMALAVGELTGTAPAEIIVGAPGRDVGAGGVYLFDGGRLTGQQAAEILPEARNNPDHMGRWLVLADLDGDGADDLVVGAPDYKRGNNGFDAGRLWAWLASGFRQALAEELQVTLLADEADLVIPGELPFQRVGRRPVRIRGEVADGLALPTRRRIR